MTKDEFECSGSYTSQQSNLKKKVANNEPKINIYARYWAVRPDVWAEMVYYKLDKYLLYIGTVGILESVFATLDDSWHGSKISASTFSLSVVQHFTNRLTLKVKFLIWF